MEIINYKNIPMFSSSMCTDMVTPDLRYTPLSLKQSSAVFVAATFVYYKFRSLV